MYFNPGLSVGASAIQNWSQQAWATLRRNSSSVTRMKCHGWKLQADGALRNAVRMLAQAGPSPYRNALQDALITQKDLWPPQAVQQLELLIGKYL